MFCVDGATEWLVQVLCGWCNRETGACFVWMVQQRDWSMFCVDGAIIERLVHVLCGWCNRETCVCFVWMVQLERLDACFVWMVQ